MAAEVPLVEYFIEICSPSVTCLSGRPKVGKSLLAEEMALAISTGGKVLGFQAKLARVFYLALEDAIARLQDRFKMGAQPDPNLALPSPGHPLPTRACSCSRSKVDEGYQVIFIDTFNRVNGKGDQMDHNEMTQVFAALQQMALAHNAAIVVVDHHRKAARNSADSDPIDDILGSTAKASVLDCALGLYRKHNSNDAILKVVGRDLATPNTTGVGRRAIHLETQGGAQAGVQARAQRARKHAYPYLRSPARQRNSGSA